MELEVLSKDGSSTGRTVELNADVFAVEVNKNVLYEDIRSFTSNARQGTAKTKGRSELRGGGRKAFRQKGTGNARRGSMRSPLLMGGGTVFGPKPRTYSVKMTKKMRQLARKSALTLKAAESQIKIVESFDFEAPKTKSFLEIMKSLSLDNKKVLVLTEDVSLNVFLSARNVPKVNVIEVSKLNTYQVVDAEVLVVMETALSSIHEMFTPKTVEA